LALSLIGVALWKWVLIRIAFTNPPWSTIGFVSLLFVPLLVGSVVGLLKTREWGFYAVYLLFPVSTILHGVALVPWVTDALPTQQLRIWSTAVLNLVFLAATILAHRMHRR